MAAPHERSAEERGSARLTNPLHRPPGDLGPRVRGGGQRRPAFRWIIHPHQIEAVSGSDLAAAAAVGGLERRPEFAFAPAVRPDFDQRADHRAHLAMQERSRARFEENLVAVAPDVEPVERADRRVRLTLRVAKGGEIVPADQDARRRVHRLGVEARLHPPGWTRVRK